MRLCDSWDPGHSGQVSNAGPEKHKRKNMYSLTALMVEQRGDVKGQATSLCCRGKNARVSSVTSQSHGESGTGAIGKRNLL